MHCRSFKYVGIFLVLQKEITNLFELESVGHGANFRVEEVWTMHVEQPLVVVHPHLVEKRESFLRSLSTEIIPQQSEQC